MKTRLQRIAAGTGFIMLIATPAIADTPSALCAWLLNAVALLLAGCGFIFNAKK